MSALTVGMTSESSFVADSPRLADRYHNPGVPVLATPHLVELAEAECVRCVAAHLEPGMSTVGIALNVRHLAATPQGMRFSMRAHLREIDRRRLVFDVEARDEREVVFTGTHERFIIELQPFLERTAAKRTAIST